MQNYVSTERLDKGCGWLSSKAENSVKRLQPCDGLGKVRDWESCACGHCCGSHNGFEYAVENNGPEQDLKTVVAYKIGIARVHCYQP